MTTEQVVGFLAAISLRILLCPVMLLAAVALILESRGPIFERQKRAGKDGQLFDLINFWAAQGRDPKVQPPHEVVDPSHEKLVGRYLA